MTIKNSLQVLMLSAFAGAAFMPAYATAQEAQQNERLQRQIDALQQQLESLQKQVSDTKKTAQKASQEASQASATAGAYAADLPARGKPPAKAAWIAPGGVKITAGGFIEAAGIWRNKNEVADVGSDFNNIPYSLSPLGHENETRFSARQSRIWLKAEGDITPAQIVKAYFEMDFLGGATTANSIESNSYTPRMRLGYLNYDDNANGWHVLAGQNWSLLTQNRAGIAAGTENIPLTIDAQYVVGFNWTRNAQIRVVKDFGPTMAFGVSAESPQVRFQSPGSATPSGLFINSANTGTQSGLFDTLQTYSTDTIPDFIEKFAFDPGWGHYEVFGLQRFFTDRVSQCTPGFTGTTCAPGGSALVGATTSNINTFGWGVGGSALLPAIPKFLDLQGSVLYGDGIGRYGSGQLPDVTFGQNGSLSPVTALQTLVGAIAHFTPDLDVYAYAGLERDNANFSNVTNPVGFGNPQYANGLCFGENNVAAPAAPASPVSGILGNGTCSVNVKQLEEITVGFWQNFYKGDMGRLVGGMQFEYIHRTTFPGLNFIGTATTTTVSPAGSIAPSVDEAIVMTSLRYYFP